MTRSDPVGTFGEGVIVMETCERCKRKRPCEPVVVLERRQTHTSPAEYAEIPMCDPCRWLAEYLSDPENAAYERAAAGYDGSGKDWR